jgi:pimeloyl-ACP methyl ester carboxylesterase
MTTWILLRGLTRETRHWGDFPPTLQAALPEARLAAIDLPGNGRLHRQESPTRIETIAARCRDQALAQGLRPPFRLLAMSLGAMVAVAWAHAHPDEVAACVLINTSLRSFNPFYQRLRPGSYPTLLRLTLPIGDRRREALVLALTSTRAAALSDVLPAWVAWRREYPVSLANALRQLIAAARYTAPSQMQSQRLLILSGRGDALVDPACSRRLAAAWRADFAEHPTAGHDLPLDDGPWVAAQVRRWLAAPPSPGRRQA